VKKSGPNAPVMTSSFGTVRMYTPPQSENRVEDSAADRPRGVTF
jgi:hypothetical protein